MAEVMGFHDREARSMPYLGQELFSWQRTAGLEAARNLWRKETAPAGGGGDDSILGSTT